jgi:hypothetical protein
MNVRRGVVKVLLSFVARGEFDFGLVLFWALAWIEGSPLAERCAGDSRRGRVKARKRPLRNITTSADAGTEPL